MRSLAVFITLAVAVGCAHTEPVSAPTQAINACRAIVEASAIARDRGDGEGYGALFTRGSEFVMGDESARGPSAIAAMMKKRARGTVTRHLLSTATFNRVSDDRITGVSYVIVFSALEKDEEGPLPLNGVRAVIEYHDTFVLVDDYWRLLRREVKPVFLPDA